MIILHRMGTLITEFADYLAKTNTAIELSRLTQSQLEELGITRGQLNTGVRDFWLNDAAVSTAAQPQTPGNKSGAGFDFGRYIAAMYSPQNRPHYMI